MDQYSDSNRALWNQWTELHEGSEFYDVAGFRAGKSSLRAIELAELGDEVAGKRLLHLQCHFGLDTLSWARLGATVTGVDISDRAIALAQRLSEELAIPARFLCSSIEGLAEVLDDQYDIVYSSYGVLHWLRDLQAWARAIAQALRPGGFFYMVEDHPFMRVFTSEAGDLKVDNPYFFDPEPWRFEARGSYAAQPAEETPTQAGYMWDHSIGEVLNALAGAGLRLEYLHEFPYAAREKFAGVGMVREESGLWRFGRQHNMVPLLFSLRVRRD
jgi:SAM-dependent methyltransferase